MIELSETLISVPTIMLKLLHYIEILVVSMLLNPKLKILCSQPSHYHVFLCICWFDYGSGSQQNPKPRD